MMYVCACVCARVCVYFRMNNVGVKDAFWLTNYETLTTSMTRVKE